MMCSVSTFMSVFFCLRFFDHLPCRNEKPENWIYLRTNATQQKFSLAVVLSAVGTATAFHVALPASKASSTVLFNSPNLGAGGMADTRDPDAYQDDDPRKSISAAPSFEEYLKMRDSGGGAAATAAPAAAPAAPAAAPAAPATPAAPAATGGGGDVLATLSGLEGPGQVWGAEGIAVGKEESDLKGYDNFDLFVSRLQSTGVANELSGPGPFTIFAPVNSAVETFEKFNGPMTAEHVKMQIVPGKIASSDVSSADLSSLGGPLTYRYAVRKHFINDVSDTACVWR